MSAIVYMESRPEVDYPKSGFHPSIRYPEYPFSDKYIQAEKNEAYDMVRRCLIGLKLDKDNFGMPQWNPLGRYIRPGDHVLIKPNWVMHKNGNRHVKENAIECLVTHPACLRAICDYCIIALNGEGQIIIGDAPMQDCDLSDLLENFHYNDILRFYEQQSQSVKFMDFRKYQATFDKNFVIVNKIFQDTNGIDIDLGERSMHEKRQGKRIYQVDNYDRNETKAYHNEMHHTYSINESVLDADVIINFCKPKSHRLAGFTAAMKNMVGITYNKASLPHRVEGAASEGGDAYPKASLVKKVIDDLLDRKIVHENQNRFYLATLDRYLYCFLLVLVKKLYKAPYIKGIWYGNDTIWRTVVDLNVIEKYADKKGKVQSLPQRQILNFADMIIAGEHNGPCQPEPKHMGVLLASESASAMDMTICKMMGFLWEKISLTTHLQDFNKNMWLDGNTESIYIESNDNNLCGRLSDLCFPQEWHFKSHDAWAEILR